jgi:hypothetical protein
VLLKQIHILIYLLIKLKELYNWGTIFRTNSNFDVFILLDKQSPGNKYISFLDFFPNLSLGNELLFSEEAKDTDNLLAFWDNSNNDNDVEKILNKANRSGTENRDNAIFDIGQSDVDIGL